MKTSEYYRVALQKEMDSRQKMGGVKPVKRVEEHPTVRDKQHASSLHAPFSDTPTSHAFPHDYPPAHTNRSLLPNGISHSPIPHHHHYPQGPNVTHGSGSGLYPTTTSSSSHNPVGGVAMYRTASTPPTLTTRDLYDAKSHAISNNCQQHFNITQQGSTYFNSSTESNTDMYDGLPETFV